MLSNFFDRHYATPSFGTHRTYNRACLLVGNSSLLEMWKHYLESVERAISVDLIKNPDAVDKFVIVGKRRFITNFYVCSLNEFKCNYYH